PPLPGDGDPPVRAPASALRRLLGAGSRSPRAVLPPHRHLGLSLVRVQPPLRRAPVPQGADLVVSHLDLGRPPPVPATDRAFPLRRPCPGALDGGVALARRMVGDGLLRAARPDRSPHRPHPPSPPSA